jgi:hypothetical protein
MPALPKANPASNVAKNAGITQETVVDAGAEGDDHHGVT